MNKNTSRRDFLKNLGVTGVTALLYSNIPIPALANTPNSITETRILMGTFVTITANHPSTTLLEEAINNAFETIIKKEAIYSHYNSSSPLYTLNKEGKLLDAPEELLHMIHQSIHIEHVTSGAFDITVKPIVDFLKSRNDPKRKTNIQPSELNDLVALTGSSYITFHNQNIEFQKQGMSITLDGIAKGYICDCASETLLSFGVNNHLINAGGDIIARGYKDTKQPWIVAIEDPTKKWHYPEILNVTNYAIATSGSYEQYFDIEHKYHHLVDPNSGNSPEICSVSVAASTTMEADALATALSIMDPKSAVKFIKQFPGKECYILEASGSKHVSPGWLKLEA